MGMVKAAGAAAILLGMAAPVAAQALPTEKVLPLDLARRIVTGAVEACQKQGYDVSVSVVDRSGILRAFGRANGAGPHTVSSSYRKAFTAASMRMPTARPAENVASNPAVEGLRDMDDRLLLLAGGLPIKAGDQVIGGVGVGGAPGGDKDAACAQAGLDRVTDQLH